jgi:hypothetical protein
VGRHRHRHRHPETLAAGLEAFRRSVGHPWHSSAGPTTEAINRATHPPIKGGGRLRVAARPRIQGLLRPRRRQMRQCGDHLTGPTPVQRHPGHASAPTRTGRSEQSGGDDRNCARNAAGTSASATIACTRRACSSRSTKASGPNASVARSGLVNSSKSRICTVTAGPCKFALVQLKHRPHAPRRKREIVRRRRSGPDRDCGADSAASVVSPRAQGSPRSTFDEVVTPAWDTARRTGRRSRRSHDEHEHAV